MVDPPVDNGLNVQPAPVSLMLHLGPAAMCGNVRQEVAVFANCHLNDFVLLYNGSCYYFIDHIFNSKCNITEPGEHVFDVVCVLALVAPGTELRAAAAGAGPHRLPPPRPPPGHEPAIGEN